MLKSQTSLQPKLFFCVGYRSIAVCSRNPQHGHVVDLYQNGESVSVNIIRTILFVMLPASGTSDAFHKQEGINGSRDEVCALLGYYAAYCGNNLTEVLRQPIDPIFKSQEILDIRHRIEGRWFTVLASIHPYCLFGFCLFHCFLFVWSLVGCGRYVGCV
jgi:hypothetical protein